MDSISLVASLEKFIKDQNVSTILDVGCGDMNWIQMVNLNGATYLGIDTEQHVQKMPLPFIKREFPRGMSLDGVWDMVICRDVLLHCRSRQRIWILERLPGLAIRFVLVSQLPEERIDGMALTGKVADLLVFQPCPS